jgi:hypothetical protein
MRAAIPILCLVLASCGGAKSGGKPAATGGGPDDDGSSTTFAAPGDCVDPLADGDRHDASRPFDKHVQLDVRNEDLDGDGVVDVFVKPAWSCGQACIRSAYVARGTCAHYVGSFRSIDRFETLDNKTNGLRDLSVRPRMVEEDGETHCYQHILQFDGFVYQVRRKRECECKDEGAKCTAWDE